ncbi:MAG: oligoendopeptidase F [Oscillospiraceae bacterium]|jgi:oligoendopeptidase F|nr:oligoendopeptidase F [Oscillospiraceae bacterium]
MELKSRKDMDPAYMWDLSHIFADDDAWEEAMARAHEHIRAAGAVKGSLGASAESLKKGLDAFAETAEEVSLCYVYASLNKSADGGDERSMRMSERASNLYADFSAAFAFLSPELLSLDADSLGERMASEPLAPYRHFVDDVVRSRSHTLDLAGEELLARLSRAAQTPSNAFGMFESVDAEFPVITDENGDGVRLTNANFSVYRAAGDPRVRREAFDGYFGVFRKFGNTLCALYSGAVKTDNFMAETRRFSGACEASLFESAVPVAVYDSLIEAVHDGLPAMRRYLDLRRRLLGLDRLEMYDLYCPLIPEADMSVSYEQAKAVVKKALAPLGEEYGRLLDKAFSEGWIDVYENKGKDSGAFSCGVYGVHPYVLLNYTDTLEDVFTLAHELGHAMHSYFSDRSNDYVNSEYSLLVAEVASTVNEVLLARYLLDTETDPGRRAYIVNRFLESFRTTVFRQTLFAEFERRAHEMDASGVPLTTSSLSALYHELNALYYDGAEINEVMDIEWARIPHFYRAFYVYQYATGFSSAVAIAFRILETGDAAPYLRFLSTGGSDYPLEELKLAGVDLRSPETVRNALRVFSDSVDELEKLTAAV